jgi:hypothetical protein
MAGTSRRFVADFTNATLADRAYFQTSTTNGSTGVGAVPNGSNQLSAFQAFNNSTPTNASWCGIVASSADVQIQSSRVGSGSYLPMAFYTSDQERMRVDTSGGLRVGTTANIFNSAASEKLSINNAVNGCAATFQVTDTSGGFPILYLSSTDATNTGTQNTVIFYRSGASQVGSITTTTTGTQYNTSSDYRLKKDVQPMVAALAKVVALKPVTYRWKSNNAPGEGFVAHELQEVAPQCVTGEKDAVDAAGNPVYQGIDTSFLVATLTAAIQEQQAIITALTARVETLEAKP